MSLKEIAHKRKTQHPPPFLSLCTMNGLVRLLLTLPALIAYPIGAVTHAENQTSLAGRGRSEPEIITHWAHTKYYMEFLREIFCLRPRKKISVSAQMHVRVEY